MSIHKIFILLFVASCTSSRKAEAPVSRSSVVDVKGEISQKGDVKTIGGGLVHFDFDSYVLQDKYISELESFVYTGGVVSISGHCDDEGTEEYNLALGAKRAEAVADFLEKRKGVLRSRMRIRSMGELQPRSIHAWQNRRAEFIIRP